MKLPFKYLAYHHCGREKITVQLSDENFPLACGNDVPGRSLKSFWIQNCDNCRFVKKSKHCDQCQCIVTITFERSFYLRIYDNGNGTKEMFICKSKKRPLIYVNGGKADNKIDLDQEFDVTPGTTIFFRKPQGHNDDPMIEFCVIEIDDNENEIDTKKVVFATTVPVTVVVVVVDDTNKLVPVGNDTIVDFPESPTATQSAQRDPPESSTKAKTKPPCLPGKSPIPSPHNNINRKKRPSLRVL